MWVDGCILNTVSGFAKIYFDPFVIMLTLGHGSLAMKNNHGFE
jgi:hypothetical protein